MRAASKQPTKNRVKVRLDDYPTRFWVSSESNADEEYIVSLCEYPRGTDQNGVPVFNGACGAPDGMRTHGCKDFKIRCEPHLKKAENDGKVFRCKHIRAAREHALDFMLPYLCKNDPNLPDNQLP